MLKPPLKETIKKFWRALHVFLFSGVIWGGNDQKKTHLIFDTRVGSLRSSLWFFDSSCRSSTPFFSSCTQNICCPGWGSSYGSPSPCSRLQKPGRTHCRKTPSIHKLRSPFAPRSIRALPWQMLFQDHLLCACTQKCFTLTDVSLMMLAFE